MTITAKWAATTCDGLLHERAVITRALAGGYRHTIGRATWAARSPEDGAEPVITITQPTVLNADDLRDLHQLTHDAYAAAHAAAADEACDAWTNSPEATQTAADLAAGTPPAETCILPAAWDPTDAITLAGRDALDDALTQTAADTARAYGWVLTHTNKPWTVTWSHI